jgi:hypothetical protein
VSDRQKSEMIHAIRLHFFGRTRTSRRDDNAIGRLWWNAYIAKQSMPDDHYAGLKALLKFADVRMHMVERPWIGTRPKLAGGILRGIHRNPDIAPSGESFAKFMRSLNKRGGGIVFEAMADDAIDSWMDRCCEQALKP